MIDEQVKTELDNGMFLGCVVTAGKPGEILFNKAYGYRDTGKAMNTETMFDLASITKVAGTSTALAILMTDSSDMSIHDRATLYLDGLTGKGGDEMTIAQLGTHTAGLDANKLNGILGEELIDQLLVRDISWPVDTKYSYSGNGTIRLSELVAQQAGMSFGNFCQERIFSPLKMTRTMFGNLPDEYRKNCVKTSRRRIGNIADQMAWRATGRNANNSRPIGNAGLFSTGSDLAKLATLWLQKGEYKGKRYFSEEIYDIFSKRQSDYGTKGILWNVGVRPEGMSKRTLFHTGYTGQSMWIDPVNQWYIMVLTTWDHEDIQAGNSVSDDARERIALKVIDHFHYLEDSIRFADSTFTLKVISRDISRDTLLPGTTIVFDGENYLTGKNGTVSITGISFGYHNLTALHEGYFSNSEERYKINSDTSYTFYLQADLPDAAFTITDRSSGNPVYRALLTLGGKSSPSASDGSGKISDLNPGTYLYTIEHPEYFDFSDTLTLAKDTSFSVRIARKWANVTIHVKSNDDQPIAGVTVTLDKVVNSTGNQGKAFFFNRNARQEYILQIIHEDYESFIDTFFLETDTSFQVNLKKDITNIMHPPSASANIYPNPVKEKMIINLPDEYGRSLISIYSPDGRKLYEKSCQDRSVSIDTGFLQKGVYYLIIHSGPMKKLLRFSSVFKI